MASVYVVDNPANKVMLARLLGEAPGVVLAGAANIPLYLLDSLRMVEPDIVLMNISLSGTDTMKMVRDISASGLRCKVIILSPFDKGDQVLDAFKAGACGYLLYEHLKTELLSAILKLTAGTPGFILSRKLAGTWKQQIQQLALQGSVN